MDEPASGPDRSAVEQLVLALFGAVVLTGERADRLADELAAAGGIRRDEVRAKLEELAGRWRGDAVRLRERAGMNIEKLAHDLGLVSRSDHEDLELRVAQLEHRLRLVEESSERTIEPAH
jgi:polyhydroxyalkanoate synthesis regulator phasin